MPFAVMAISAYFSVLALGKMMRADLSAIYIVSTVVVLIVFMLFCGLSIAVCRRTLCYWNGVNSNNAAVCAGQNGKPLIAKNSRDMI